MLPQNTESLLYTLFCKREGRGDILRPHLRIVLVGLHSFSVHSRSPSSTKHDIFHTFPDYRFKIDIKLVSASSSVPQNTVFIKTPASYCYSFNPSAFLLVDLNPRSQEARLSSYNTGVL